MRLRSTFAAAALLASACGSYIPPVFSAPAPATALECSLRTLSALGYSPVQGGIADGYIKFDRRNSVSAGAAMAAHLPGVSRPADGAFITVTSAAQTLRVTVTGYHLSGAGEALIAPNDEARGHAEGVIATCANPATHDVQGNPTH